jgi:hypothetical protein
MCVWHHERDSHLGLGDINARKLQELMPYDVAVNSSCVTIDGVRLSGAHAGWQ